MAPSAAPSAAASAAALTGNLTIWEAYGASGAAEKDAFDQILQNVQAANPGLTVTDLDVPFNNLFTKFETSAASSGVPDLFIAPADSLPKEARAGLLVDLTSILPQLSNFSPAAVQGATVDGKLYAIPESMKGVALFYNTSLLPTAPVTTDDWITDASKLGWVYGANGGGSYYLWGLFPSFGGTILDPTTGKCAATATSGVADALTWLQKAKAAGLHMYQNDTAAVADLVAGKIAGFIDGPWQSANLEKALGSKLAVAPGPSGPGGGFGPLVEPDGYYINANAADEPGHPVRAADGLPGQRADLRRQGRAHPGHQRHHLHGPEQRQSRDQPGVRERLQDRVCAAYGQAARQLLDPLRQRARRGDRQGDRAGVGRRDSLPADGQGQRILEPPDRWPRPAVAPIRDAGRSGVPYHSGREEPSMAAREVPG
jgi:hypothetical protein